MFKKLMHLLCTIALCYCVKAQDTPLDSSFVKAASANAVSLYYQFTDKQSRLYNGPEHFGYPSTIIGHAYYLTNEFQKGSVLYDGIFFKDIPMLYNMYTDELVILHYNNFLKITLLSEKLSSFDYNGHHFVHLVHDSLRVPVTTGFYDKLHSGKTTVYAKRYKLLDEKVTDHIEREFLESTSYYVVKQGTFHQVKTKKGLFKVFNDKSKEVRQYLRKNGIKFRKNKEGAIVAAAKFYDAPNQ